MRHLTVSEFGSFLGITGQRLVITGDDGKTWETPLSRLRSIRIAKKGVSLSSNLILECAARGIRLYFVDWRNIATAAVSGQNQHAVVVVRQAQFECIKSDRCIPIAIEMIISKIRNQRAVLLYFSKYQGKVSSEKGNILRNAADQLDSVVSKIRVFPWLSRGEKWKNELIGQEGLCANLYWQALAESNLLGETFTKRYGRGAIEINNAALNYGYAILQSYAWSALDNAGLELYAGLLHANRPGRASLVLDFMEEYRAWVVDRNIITLRSKLNSGLEILTQKIKSTIVDAIDSTMASKINWRGKNIRLENIMQRQAYRLAGAIIGDRSYRGYRFKW